MIVKILWLIGAMSSFLLPNIQTEWVEIPQISAEPNKSFLTKRTDYYSLLLTTSTTTQSTVIIRPATYKRNSYTNFTTNITDAGVKYKYNNVTKKVHKDEVNCTKDTHSNFCENEPFVEEDPYHFLNILPFLKSVQSSLIRNSHKSVESKTQVLRNLKDSMLLDIEEKIAALWQTRKTRSISEDEYHKDDHHMDFPSNEGALMTIGFLTFGVFLIKLIMHLVSAIKGHHHNGMPKFGRKRRSLMENEFEVRRAIDDYLYK